MKNDANRGFWLVVIAMIATLVTTGCIGCAVTQRPIDHKEKDPAVVEFIAGKPPAIRMVYQGDKSVSMPKLDDLNVVATSLQAKLPDSEATGLAKKIRCNVIGNIMTCERKRMPADTWGIEVQISSTRAEIKCQQENFFLFVNGAPFEHETSGSSHECFIKTHWTEAFAPFPLGKKEEEDM